MAETRRTLLSYLHDQPRRGKAIQFSHRYGLRTKSWSYKKVAQTAYKVGRELEARGVVAGERVLLCGNNSPEWVVAFWGCLLVGAVVVPLDKESTVEFISKVQRDTDARLVFDGAGSLATGLCIPQLRLEDLEDSVSRRSSAPYLNSAIHEDTLAEIIFTSGTTQAPKGVLLTHGNLLANLLPLETEIAKYAKWRRLVDPLRFLNLVPLSHVFGQFMAVFVPQLLGGEVHFQHYISAAEIIQRTKRSRISVIVLVPRLLESLREFVEKDYSAKGEPESLRELLTASGEASFPFRWWRFRRVHRRVGWKFWAFISGGASLDEQTERFWRGLGFAVLQGYGMTETASLVSVNHPFRQGRGSVGKVLPGHEVKLDELGEIMVRGASVSPGYWSRDGNVPKPGKAWLRTGDLGEIDADGNVHFKGRKKDVIVTAAGLNIHPEDLEAAINRQSEVRASCVITWEAARGPEPLAVLILRSDRASAADVIEGANRQLAAYQQIRRWTVWKEPDFPRTATHKVLKREVAARISSMAGNTEGTNGAGEESRENGYSTFVLAEAARISGDAPRNLSSSANLTTDLRLDSIGRVELLASIEDHYHIEIDEAAFTNTTTVAEIERIVHTRKKEAGAKYPYPNWTRRFPLTWMREVLFYAIVLPITRVLSRLRVSGLNNLNQLNGPTLYIANHVTLADHALILVALPAHIRRRLAIAMDGEIIRSWLHPPGGTGVSTRLRLFSQYCLVTTFFHVFPLPKQSGFRRGFAYAGECMDRGESVLVFPEGERAPLGQMYMSSFKNGIGLLAREMDAPVVPVRLHGLYELKKRKQHFAPAGSVKVVFGKPLKFDADEEPAEIAAKLQRYVELL